MSDLTAAQLHTALRAGAADRGERAAIDLLIVGTPHLLTPTRPDVLQCVSVDPEDERYAVVLWGRLAERVRAGQIPTSRSEAQIVAIASSLAEPGQMVALNIALGGLDDIRAAAVLGAIRHVLRGA